jgi:MoxR-like ATPase
MIGPSFMSDTITEWRLGKKHGNTYEHRVTLTQLGFRFDGETKEWVTWNEEQFAQGYFLVTGQPYSARTDGQKDGEVNATESEIDLTGNGRGFTDPQLNAALKALGGGSVGFDYARVSKAGRIAYGVEKYGSDALMRAIRFVIETEAKEGPEAPRKPSQADRLNELGKAPVAPAKAPSEAPPVPPADDVTSAVAALRKLMGTGVLDEARVRAIADEAVKDGVGAFAQVIDDAVKAAVGRPKILEVRSPGATVQVKGAHRDFERVMKCVGAGLNVLMTGPSGCGKSVIAKHVAQGLNRPFHSESFSGGKTESAITARLLPSKGGDFIPVDSQWLHAYANGYVIFADELDAADANVWIVANEMLGSDGFHCEIRAIGKDGTARDEAVWVKRHPNTVLIGAMNTFGTGPNMMFQGRNALDAASLDRWLLLEVSYDEAIDRAYEVDDQTRNFVNWVLAARKIVLERGMKRVVSHRMTAKGCALLAAGFKQKEVREMLLVGWTKDEVLQVKDADTQS